MKYWTVFGLLIFSTGLYATKPCPLSKCINYPVTSTDPAQYFDKNKCIKSSDWVATGQIKVKTHNFIGMLLNKDFMSFDFIVKNWEKGKELIKEQIPFKVGWCNNPLPPNSETKGIFRFYGVIIDKLGEEKEYGYLYIEKISEKNIDTK